MGTENEWLVKGGIAKRIIIQAPSAERLQREQFLWTVVYMSPLHLNFGNGYHMSRKLDKAVQAMPENDSNVIIRLPVLLAIVSSIMQIPCSSQQQNPAVPATPQSTGHSPEAASENPHTSSEESTRLSKLHHT